MYNELLFFGEILASFLLVMLAYKLFGKIGLFVWAGMAVILANIQVFKTIQIFGLVTAMGNVIYSSIFLVTDIFNEVHTKKDAQQSVWIGFFVLLAVTALMQISLLFIPDASDLLSPHLTAIFSLLPRIAFASLAAYLISQSFDVWLYSILKKKEGKARLWLRNNVSTMISQLIDNSVFTLIAFVGAMDWNIILEIFTTSYILKFLIAAADTPFIYWARSLKKTGILMK